MKTIKAIYNDVIPKLTVSDIEWKQFLKFSAKVWKHKFDTKILIY